MTVEAVRQEKRFFGLHTRERRTILDYRSWNQKKSSTYSVGKQPDRVLIDAGNIFNITREPAVFAMAVSEDEIVTFKSHLRIARLEVKKYRKEEINDASIIGVNGERVVWRETQPGDYPTLPDGAVLAKTTKHGRRIPVLPPSSGDAWGSELNRV